jgi:2-methylaconitate cis-trans-isomerase PrpF
MGLLSREISVPAVIMRGGTSKGVFLHAADLPPAGPDRDRVLLDLLGSPDPMQIDGLGGTYSSTSKAVLVERSQRPDADVDYWFAQVGVDEPIVDWDGNCGNLTTAVGPFAINEGLVAAVEPETTVRCYNGNTGVMIVARVPVSDGAAATEGDLRIPGVPSPGAPVTTDYLDPSGGVLGAALPTGSVSDIISFDGHDYDISLLDVTHPMVFVRSEHFGLKLTGARPPELNGDPALLEHLEALRGRCSELVGAVSDWTLARTEAPVVPKVVLVEEPLTDDTEADIVALGVSMGKIHHALPMTAALCLAAAAAIPGTVPHQARRDPAGPLRIRHPKGVVAVTADVDTSGATPIVRSVGVVRTARRLISGTAWLRQPI